MRPRVDSGPFVLAASRGRPLLFIDMIEESDDVAGRLAAELAASGDHVDDGAFEIDAVRGLEKLGRYQLADPRAYVLRLAEAGVRLGAEEVAFWIDRRELTVGFLRDDDPITLPRVAHERLLEVLVGKVEAIEHEREAIVQLAIGVNAALANGPRSLWVDSVGAEGRGHRLAFDGGRRASFVAIEGGDPGLWIRLVRGDTGLGAGLRGAVTREREIELLRERGRWSPTPILVNQRWISGTILPGNTAGRPIVDDEGHEIGRATLLGDEIPELSDRACIVLLSAGIEVERVVPPRILPGFFAVVEAKLGRDLTRSEFTRGPEFDALIARVLKHAAGTKFFAVPAEPRAQPTKLSDIGARGVAFSVVVALAGGLAIVASTLAASQGLFLTGVGALLFALLTGTFAAEMRRPASSWPEPSEAIDGRERPGLGAETPARPALPPAQPVDEGGSPP